MRIHTYIAMLLLLIPVIRRDPVISPGTAGDQDDPECLACHGELLEKAVVHAVAADGCDNCHLSTGATHPGDSAGFTLMDRVPELCFYCHEGPVSLAHPHLPVEQGACLDCHDVHASGENGLIKEPEQTLCLSCHGGSGPDQTVDIQALISGSHKPHSAIEGGGCISCHLPHGSEERALLVAPYAKDNYVPAAVEQFELCFLCHDTDLMEAAETGWATGFRNGDRNLHQLHIRGPKGRNCRLCHNLHGAVQPYLIEERVPFGSWEMEIRFIPEENGGSCQPGCHKTERYERN
jgi:predicted CXXCH cytochrome family protein